MLTNILRLDIIDENCQKNGNQRKVKEFCKIFLKIKIFCFKEINISMCIIPTLLSIEQLKIQAVSVTLIVIYIVILNCSVNNTYLFNRTYNNRNKKLFNIESELGKKS